MNNEILYKAINDYQTTVYNLILEDINLGINEIKKQNMNPVKAYKYLKNILDANYEDLIFSFAASNQVPLSDDVQSKIEKYIEPFYLEAKKYAKQSIIEETKRLETDDLFETYDFVKNVKHY